MPRKKNRSDVSNQNAREDAASSACRKPTTGDALELMPTPGYYPGFRTLDQQNYWDAATRKVVLDRVQHVPPLRFFGEEERLTMQAVVDRVLPQDDRAPGMRIPLLPRIDERLHLNQIDGYRFADMPSDQDAYQRGARAIDAMAREMHGQAFHLLATLQQETLLQSLHDGIPLASKALWQSMNVQRFWTMLVTDCCTAYYAHPYAWDEIGFGGPAYPRGYIRLEDGEAEPWEKEERRYEWLAPHNTLSDNPICDRKKAGKP
ncbi:MAG TPA: gluconate 2-dehydrogenase subunit 3 family protein [Acidobacteriaceae bacterium]|nr:gluconate 2-dehydrogenase subunit 3 family protein [Acidobacteriaceae bacterium]